MKFYLRLLRIDGQWITEDDLPFDGDGQKVVNSVVGFQPEDTMLDIEMVVSEDRRRAFRETDYSPAEYSSRIVVHSIDFLIDNKPQAFRNSDLLSAWLVKERREQLTEACIPH